MELLSDRGELEEERDLCMSNRRKRPQSTIEEVGKLGGCDRPLTKKDWVEMAIDKQWVTLGAMCFLKVEKRGGHPKDPTTATTNAASDSPEIANRPSPKAPGVVQTYSADPSPGVWHYLGDAERIGNDAEGKDNKGEDSKGKEPVGTPKTKTRTGKIASEKAIRTKKRICKRGNQRIVKKERIPPSIIPRIRHGGWGGLGTDGRDG